MRFALLGESDELLELARVISETPEHQIVAWSACPLQRERLGSLVPKTRFEESWEALLHNAECDGILADGNHAPERGEQLRKIVQSGSPLLVVHPVANALLAFELDMIRQGNGCLMLPYFPQWNLGLADLRKMLADPGTSEIGAVEQLDFERCMAVRDRREVLRQLSADVSLVRQMLGTVEKVSAMGDLNADGPCNLSVTMSGEGVCIARWSIAPALSGEEATVSLSGTRGKALVRWSPQDVSSVRLAFPGQDALPARHYPAQASALAAIGRFEQMIRARQDHQSWLAACLDLEVAEIVPDALRRGRTIELHQEARTESGNFKGVMAMGSCGLLVLAFLVLLLVVIVEGVRLPFRHYLLWKAWPFYLLAPLMIFLIMQLLQLIVPKSPESKPGVPQKPPTESL